MIELSVLVWIMAIFFGYIGMLRGWTKELIASSGIILGLFALYQFDTLLRVQLLGALPNDQRFYIQSFIFIVIVFFAYQTRAVVGSEANRARGGDGRDPLQNRVLGAIVGFANGYMIGGSIWYFLDINRLPTGQYPLAPHVIAPLPGTASAAAIPNLPLYLLTQGGANGDLLSLLVVILFIVVLVMI